MLGLVNKVKREYRSSIISSPVLRVNQTALESLVFKYRKGCSAANNVLLREQRLKWPQGEVPPSHRTYTNDGITQISKESFLDAFTSIYKSDLLPSIKWTSLQILLRTFWTQAKESNLSRQGDDRCLNCLQHPWHTTHLMVTYMGGSTGLPSAHQGRSQCFDEIDTTCDLVLFHKVPATVSHYQLQDIIDLLLIFKHVTYRIRFREIQNREPTVKLVIISLILERNSSLQK